MGTKKMLAAVAAKIGEWTGVGRIAALAVEADERAVARLVALARKHGVSERRIASALRGKAWLERAQSLVAILFPIVPSPTVMRALAGRKKPAAPRRPARRRAPD